MANISVWHVIVLLAVLGVPAAIIGGASLLKARGGAASRPAGNEDGGSGPH